jgi:hypothetical protein
MSMTYKTPLIRFSPRSGLLGLASTIALMAAMPAIGQTTPDCRLVDGVLPEACEQPNSDLVIETPVAPNQQQGDEGEPPRGFSITLDGETVAGEDREQIAGDTSLAGVQRGQDIPLDAADVQVRYDGIRDDRKLNVLTDDLRTEFRSGETVTFRTSTNYARWIARAKIRVTPIRRGVARAAKITMPVQPAVKHLGRCPLAMTRLITPTSCASTTPAVASTKLLRPWSAAVTGRLIPC